MMTDASNDRISEQSKTEALRASTESLLDRPDASIEDFVRRIEEMIRSREKTLVEGLDDSLHIIPPSVPRSYWNGLGRLISEKEEECAKIGRVDGSRWMSLRLDGHGFKRTVRALKKAGILEEESSCPPRLEGAMRACLRRLMNETNARVGFAHSDEFVVFVPPTKIIDGTRRVHLHNGRVQKLTSLASGFVSSCFAVGLIQQCRADDSDDAELLIDALADLSPHFDCRLGSHESWDEARGLLLWRAYDCSVNGVSDAIRHHGGLEMNGRGTIDKLRWLSGRGLLPLPRHQAYGTLMVRSKKLKIAEGALLEMVRRGHLKDPENLVPASVGGGSAVQNAEYDEDYLEFQHRGLNMRKVKDRAKENDVPLPRTRDDRDACPAYHIVGNCNVNCKMAYDHRPQCDDEKSSMLMWCREVFALFDAQTC